MSHADGTSSDSSALTGFLLHGRTLSDALTHVSRAAVDAVKPAAFAGVTMNVDRKTVTGVFTDETAPHIDQAQYESGRGPCVDAFRTGQVVRVDSTGLDRNYPEFSVAAARHGIRSVISMPLNAAGDTFGALNLYSHSEDGFDDDDETSAQQFSAQAAIVLANASAYERSVTLSDQLETAMKSRETIDLARGILMASTRCTDERAFQRLIDQSQQTNTKLRLVAEEIVRNANHAAQ